MSGWAEGDGGGMLAHAIAAAFARAEQRDLDNQPCGKCGGDCLRTDFTGSGRCHASRPVAGTPLTNQAEAERDTNHENRTQEES